MCQLKKYTLSFFFFKNILYEIMEAEICEILRMLYKNIPEGYNFVLKVC